MRSRLARLALAALLLVHADASSHDRQPKVALPRRAVHKNLAGGARKPLLLAASQPAAAADASIDEKSAVRNTILSFVATIAFGLGVILPLKGGDGCINFFTAFLVEKSLSVDNLFVFLMIFDHFQVPDQYTQRVLKWGILSALVMRGFMIAAGVAVLQRFRPMLLVFSVILAVSAIKMLQPEEEEDISDSAIMRISRKLFDATDHYDGENFWTVEKGVRRATPLLVVLVCVELSDVIFAVDSIPAVVGITADPLVVYSSNVFALMALRSLYLLLAKSVQALPYLRHAVALILLFISGKMCAEYFHFHMHKFVSPAVILALLVGGTALSLHSNRKAAAAQQQGQQPAAAAPAQSAPLSPPRAPPVRVPPSVAAPPGADPYLAQRPAATSAA